MCVCARAYMYVCVCACVCTHVCVCVHFFVSVLSVCVYSQEMRSIAVCGESFLTHFQRPVSKREIILLPTITAFAFLKALTDWAGEENIRTAVRKYLIFVAAREGKVSK